MVDFTVAERNALESSTQRMGIFFRLDTAPLVQLWFGVGWFGLQAGQSTQDPGGALYTGFGELRDIPSLTQVINGRADRVEISLSGVSENIIALAANEDAAAVKHRAADVGIGILSESWQLLGQVHWLRRGYVDYLSVSEESGSDPDAPTVRIISLSIGGLMTGRRRAGLSYWTDQDQKRRSPTDRFCERTVLLSEVEKTWPRFED